MRYILILLLSLNFMFAGGIYKIGDTLTGFIDRSDIKLNVGGHNILPSNTKDYSQYINYNFNYYGEQYESSSLVSYYKNQLKDDLNIVYGLDTVLKDDVSYFIKAQRRINSALKNDYYRLMYGATYLVSSSILDFPYRQKIGLALIHQTDSSIKTSLRYKIKGYWNKVGFKSTIFWLSGGKSIDLGLTYRLNSNLNMFYTYNYIEENRLEDDKNVIGIEIKL